MSPDKTPKALIPGRPKEVLPCCVLPDRVRSIRFVCEDHCRIQGGGEAEIDWAKVDSFSDGSLGPGILLEFLVLAYCFIGLGIVCDNHLCPALETLCSRA